MPDEQYTKVEIIMETNIPDIQAYFGKMELHPDRQVQKNYISSVDGEGSTDKKGWILKKVKGITFIYTLRQSKVCLRFGERCLCAKVYLY